MHKAAMKYRERLPIERVLLGGLVFLVGTIAPLLTAMAACTISTTSVNFGTYNVFSTTPLDSTGSVTYTCESKDKNIVVTLDRGGAPTFNPRQMSKGSEKLNYNLYLNAARTTIWGDGTGGTSTHTDKNPTPFQAITVTIYGRVPASQDVTAGSYSNTVVATILF